MNETPWTGRKGPPCQHCNGPTKWVQRLRYRDLICEDAECWLNHLPPPRVDEPAQGIEGVQLIVNQGGMLQVRREARGVTVHWPLSVDWRGWYAGYGGYTSEKCTQASRIIHIACADGVLRWATMSQLEPAL